MSFKDLNIIIDILPTLSNSEVRNVKKLAKVEFNSAVSKKILVLFNKLRYPKSAISLKQESFKSDLDKRKRAEEYGRLRHVIEQSILLNITQNQSEKYSDVFFNKFLVSLQVIVAEIVKSRGLVDFSVKKLDHFEKVARDYQLYDQIIDILHIKADLGYSGSIYYDLDKVLKEINFFENCRKRVNESKIIYRDYFSKNVKKGIQKGNVQIIRSCLDRLEKFSKETRSNLIQLKIYLFKMELFLIQEKYHKGTETGLEAISFLHENQHIKTNTRTGYFYFNIAETELGALRFSKSLEYAIKAKSFVVENSLNRLISSQFFILSSIYHKEPSKAIRELKELEQLRILDSYPFYQSKFNYYQAMIYFIEEDFDRAWKALSIHFDLEKDKEGWRVWLSIMRILCQIERREFVDVDLMVQTFKKYIKKWEERSEIREREKLVFKIIESLNRNDFDYSSTNQEHADTLVLLKSKVKELRWRPNSPELIIFQDWFKSKVEKKPYSPSYSAYKLSD